MVEVVGEVGSTYSDMLKTLKSSLKEKNTVKGIRGIRNSVVGNLLSTTDKGMAEKIKQRVQRALSTSKIKVLNGEREKLIHLKWLDRQTDKHRGSYGSTTKKYRCETERKSDSHVGETCFWGKPSCHGKIRGRRRQENDSDGQSENWFVDVQSGRKDRGAEMLQMLEIWAQVVRMQQR